MTTKLRRFALWGLVALCTVTAAGCWGRFRIFSAVYEFNKGVGNRFLRSLVMVLLVVIPVYEIAAIVDILILNVVEFWTGDAIAREQILPDGTHLVMERVATDVLRVRWTDRDGRVHETEIVKVAERAGLIRRIDGSPVATVEETADGHIARRLASEPPRFDVASETGAAPY